MAELSPSSGQQSTAGSRSPRTLPWAHPATCSPRLGLPSRMLQDSCQASRTSWRGTAMRYGPSAWTLHQDRRRLCPRLPREHQPSCLEAQPVGWGCQAVMWGVPFLGVPTSRLHGRADHQFGPMRHQFGDRDWGHGVGFWGLSSWLPVNLLSFASSSQDDSGGQSASAEPPELDVNAQHGENSARGPNGPGIQHGTKTSQGTPGSHRTLVTPEKLGDVPSDQMRTSDASTTTTGTQPESLSTQVTTTGVEPGSPSTQATALGMQTRSPGTKTTTLHPEPGATGTQSTTPGMQPGSPGTHATTPGMQPGSPGTHVITLEMEPGSPGTRATTPGMQPGSPGTQSTTPGMQPGSPGTHATTPGMQPGSPGTHVITLEMEPGPPGTRATTPGMQPGSPGTQSTTPGMQPGSPGTRATTPGMQPGSPGTHATTPGVQPGSPGTHATTPGMQPGSPGTHATTPGMQPGSPGTHATTPGMQSASPGTHATTPGMQPGSPSTCATTPGTQLASQGTRLNATNSRHGDKALPSTVPAQAGHPAAQTIQTTAQGFEIPPNTAPRATSPWKEPVMLWESSGSSGTAVEVEQAFHQIGQLGHLCAALKEQVAQLEATKSDRTELENLHQLFLERGQESTTSILANLQGLAKELQEKAEKIRQLESALGNLRFDGAGRKADDSGQIALLLGSPQHEMKQELQAEQQETTKATLEQLVTKTSEQLQAEQLHEPRVPTQSGGQEQAGCPICNSDTKVQVAKLLQRYEKLQELVESSMSQQMVGKMQDELLKCIQATIMQVQGDYKQLSSALRNLLDDHHQEQKAIEKADKAALADKVSCSQFEACVERLNAMMEEVTSRVTGQEKGWHQFQRQLQTQMDSKLDRRELGPFRQHLEERWKSLRGQLQEKVLQPERDDAAGIRKQLLADFHCLSCDRPLNMLAPGPEQTGECRYPTVPRSCGGPHTLTPPRFQPHLPSAPRRLPPIARCLNKKDVMLLCQNSISAGQQDGQLPVLGDQAGMAGSCLWRPSWWHEGDSSRVAVGCQVFSPPMTPLACSGLSLPGFQRDNPELSLRQRDSPDTESSLSQSGTPCSLEHQRALSQGSASDLGHLSPAPGLLPPPQPHQNGSAP
ncbi:glutamine-rich protein 2 isoform X3 [Columba livia]|uniref:glutamine-rich protein 2 isoform X3 n=1 Tax=Columba livia TaxID=8932 RepID=UPI0031BB4EF3